MNNILKLSFFVILTIFANLSFALEIPLINGTVEGEAKTVDLRINVDSNYDIVSLKVVSNDPRQGNLVDTYQTGQVYDGVVLYQEGKRDIVELQSNTFSSHQGGEVTLTFLYNGITGSRRSVTIDVYRDGDMWKVAYDGREFTTFHFVKHRKRFVGVVGIKRIEFR